MTDLEEGYFWRLKRVHGLVDEPVGERRIASEFTGNENVATAKLAPFPAQKKARGQPVFPVARIGFVLGEDGHKIDDFDMISVFALHVSPIAKAGKYRLKSP